MAVDTVDVAVIGAGPAGLAAATQAAKSGLSVVLLDEQEAVGAWCLRPVRLKGRSRFPVGPYPV
jgi:flavin-dependent dehydrogenase